MMVAEESDLTGWRETAHLLNSPRNAERLLRSIREADADELTAHDLVPVGNAGA
jgi:antitoxin YefM